MFMKKHPIVLRGCEANLDEPFTYIILSSFVIAVALFTIHEHVLLFQSTCQEGVGYSKLLRTAKETAKAPLMAHGSTKIAKAKKR